MVTVDYALLILVTLKRVPHVMRAKRSLFLTKNGKACMTGGGYQFHCLMCHACRRSLLLLVHGLDCSHSLMRHAYLLLLVHSLCQGSLLLLVHGLGIHRLLRHACRCSLLLLVHSLHCLHSGSLLPLFHGQGCSHSQACQGSHDNLLPAAGSSLRLSI